MFSKGETGYARGPRRRPLRGRGSPVRCWSSRGTCAFFLGGRLLQEWSSLLCGKHNMEIYLAQRLRHREMPRIAAWFEGRSAQPFQGWSLPCYTDPGLPDKGG